MCRNWARGIYFLFNSCSPDDKGSVTECGEKCRGFRQRRYFGDILCLKELFVPLQVTTMSGATDSSLPLNVRKSLRDAEPFKIKLEDRIEQATGHRYEFVVDFKDVHEKATDRDDLDKMGQVFFGDEGYFGRFVECLEKEVKDDLFKEVFIEKTSSRKIKFVFENVWSGEEAKIENNALVLRHSRFNLWMVNFSKLQLSKLL
jgi:hypothetical protein